MKKIIIFLCIASISLRGYTQEFKGLKELIGRRVPWLSSSVFFRAIPDEAGRDVFELSSQANGIHIAASTPSAAAMGVNWYLKYYCHRSMSHLGDNLSPVAHLPKIKGSIRIVSPYKYRYALNYCTLNYTMSFYKWKDWERELDWMALNGFNLVLAPVGTELIWQNTLKQMEFTEKEIADFIPGPAFTGWWLMGNLEGWGGVMSQTMIHQQAALGKKIIERMALMGIEPVTQGFYGMVPTTLQYKFPDARIKKQGKWAGNFTRPDVLLPDDEIFTKMANIYYLETRKLYGKNIKYFGGDLFHEGGSSEGVDLTKTAGLIQQNMQQNFPGSTWVFQAWGSNPSKELLKGLDKNHTLVMELVGEHPAQWKKREGFEGTPFVLSPVSNFGEKVGLFGRLEYFNSVINSAKNSPYNKLFTGIGIMPEGINNNPVVFDLLSDLGWQKDSLVVKDWIENYVWYRYGYTNDELRLAWQLLLHTVYSSPTVHPDGPPESIFCARPGLDLKSASAYGTSKLYYDTALFNKAVVMFKKAVLSTPELNRVETYRADKVDFMRQVNANKGQRIYQQMISAIKIKDLRKFRAAYARFEKALLSQDALLNTNKHFTLSRWLQQANDFGSNVEDKKLAIHNAKTQISYWGPDNNPGTDLHEYANKEWGGMLSSLYLQRWRKFANDVIGKMKGEVTYPIDYYGMELEWSNK
ncbi:alpha-N-acetylglucosaminidase [Pedobacter nutrimenti]|uniref:alpha-N-acetylglucosaminidase n=1 Tax=Pedobacter nutrimenti TaxID=1241337 RepID=UPI00292DFCF9|nr:alpha-N-acetylglucosaminidase [Pedobacter nutrimenti]